MLTVNIMSTKLCKSEDSSSALLGNLFQHQRRRKLK